MNERADFRKFYRDAHAVGNLIEREKMEGIIGTFLASGARSFTPPGG